MICKSTLSFLWREKYYIFFEAEFHLNAFCCIILFFFAPLKNELSQYEENWTVAFCTIKAWILFVVCLFLAHNHFVNLKILDASHFVKHNSSGFLSQWLILQARFVGEWTMAQNMSVGVILIICTLCQILSDRGHKCSEQNVLNKCSQKGFMKYN